jgi:FkbM family methyltransferase
MSMHEDGLQALLPRVVREQMRNDWPDNWDYRRFGPEPEPGIRTRIVSGLRDALVRMGVYRNRALIRLLDDVAQLQWLYDRLQDVESREWMVQVLAFRVLGHRKVRLPLNTSEYWHALENLERRAATGPSLGSGFQDWALPLHDLSGEGYPIRVHARASGVYTQMLLQQYRCELADHAIEVEPGDVVIDGGGCFGDTALYFAHKAGPDGRVFSFEFMPDNIRVFDRNLELNPGLAERIDIVPNPLWSSSGQKLYVEGAGPGAHITPAPKSEGAMRVETLTIDDLLLQKGLDRIDFIKMDIEGAELEALKGAEAVIRRFRPKLAISVYHRLPDFWEIPQWIEGLGLGYRFHLRHFTLHAEETVLFAEATSCP